MYHKRIPYEGIYPEVGEKGDFSNKRSEAPH